MRSNVIYGYGIALIIGGVCGGFLAFLDIHSRFSIGLLGASWLLSIILLIFAIVVLALAWRVRKFAKGDLAELAPEKSVLALLLARTSSLAGVILIGFYAGQALVCMSYFEIERYRTIVLQCLIIIVTCIIDVIAGLVAEQWCKVLPRDPKDNKGGAGQSASSAELALNTEKQIYRNKCDSLQ